MWKKYVSFFKGYRKRDIAESCVYQLEGTYWEAGAGTWRAVWEDRRGGTWPSCSASCSSCKRTPGLWPPCCWTAEALLSPWWAGAAGSWPSSDCAKAWFGSVWLWWTHRGIGRWAQKPASTSLSQLATIIPDHGWWSFMNTKHQFARLKAWLERLFLVASSFLYLFTENQEYWG